MPSAMKTSVVTRRAEPLAWSTDGALSESLGSHTALLSAWSVALEVTAPGRRTATRNVKALSMGPPTAFSIEARSWPSGLPSSCWASALSANAGRPPVRSTVPSNVVSVFANSRLRARWNPWNGPVGPEI